MQAVNVGEMVIYKHGSYILLWFLIYHWKCSAAIPGHLTWSEDSNNSTTSEGVDIRDYMYSNGQDLSHVISPGKDTPECAIPWSCCDHEANQNRDILPHGIVTCRKHNTLSVRSSYC